MRKPSTHLLKYLDELLNINPKSIRIAEVGVGLGVTTIEIKKKCEQMTSWTYLIEVIMYL